MALSNYTPESREIVLKGGSFTIRGLGLEDVSVLVREHLPDIEALFTLLQNANAVQHADMLPIAHALVSQAPGFAANVIALACGEPDAVEHAKKIPAPVQIDLIMQIGDMTFSEVGGVKKSLELIVALLQKNKPMLTEMMAKAE